MATLLDTSALVALIRRSPGRTLDALRGSCREEIDAGRAVVSAVTVVELGIGARDAGAARRVSRLLELLPVVSADREIAFQAGRMGAYARSRGATIPLPDLLIAATAVWLDLPLLTCDSDFGRGAALGDAGKAGWERLRLHAASVV